MLVIQSGLFDQIGTKITFNTIKKAKVLTELSCANDQASGQSYKHFTFVNYDSRVIIWGIFQSGTTLES